MPLHLNWQLYGWCALPLAGALLAWCLDFRHPQVRGHAQLVLGLWSLALALGGLSWLGGVSSGKLFLDWHGWARPVLPLAMVALWSFLGAHTVWRWPDLDRTGRLLRVGVLAGLVVVPPLLHWAAGRAVYPPVNPDSGGATGAALLGSTLALVSLYGLLPRMLGVPATRSARWFWPALGLSWIAYSLIGHGHTSHHDLAQIVALGLLFFWVPGLALWWRAGNWHPAARPWQTAALVWWALLVADGWLAFLPGLSERCKFTHALVAHSHLAMAGLVTSAGLMILTQFARRPVARASFWAWQLGCAVHVAALLVLGWDEIAAAHALFRSETWTQLLLGLRLAAGAMMTIAAARWWLDFRAP
jgi:cytochrome c oxidase cbb3-type subunit 1